MLRSLAFDLDTCLPFNYPLVFKGDGGEWAAIRRECLEEYQRSLGYWISRDEFLENAFAVGAVERFQGGAICCI